MSFKSKLGTASALGKYATRRWLGPGFEGTVFVGGPAHSGTSILTRIIANHESFYCPDEELELYRGNPKDQMVRFAKLAHQSARNGRERLVEKSPANILHTDTLRKTAPGCQFIFTIRDFRDVVASQKKRFGDDMTRPINNWIKSAEAYLQEKDRRDVFALCYEDFVVNTSPLMGKMFNFLRVNFNSSILNFHENPVTWYGQKEVRKGSGATDEEHRALRNWQINQPIFDGRGKWRESLTHVEQQALQDHPISKIAESFGYRW